MDVADIDRFVVDGWFTQRADGAPAIATFAGGKPLELPVAPYTDGPTTSEPLARYSFDGYDFGPSTAGYSSYHHVSNHLLGAYCSSPFAMRGEDAVVLIWDGGMIPRLYHVEAGTRTITTVPLGLPLLGNSFAEFSASFGPFRKDTSGMSADETLRHHLSIAGKAMAYAALGTVQESAFAVFDQIIGGFVTVAEENGRQIGEKALVNRDELLPGLTDSDLIATFQAYLGRLLMTRLTAVMGRRLPWQQPSSVVARRGSTWRPNLVLGGGCALNIKWNSMLRDSGLFADIWVPPFANDSGAAIGTASCEMFRETARSALRWDVYSGPRIAVGDLPADWQQRPCDVRQLAQLLHTEGEPVVVLSGRAEIGPRALGNRSILAPAGDAAMKTRLNEIKDRAGYRPVAPICLTSRSAEVFEPGGADPYMLFEHRMRPGWADRVPAVVHLDGTARLQTIDREGAAAGQILAAYAELSGIPVLCNTSANFNGSGFFPDVASAAAWGGTKYIWSDDRLFINPKHGSGI